MTRNKLEGIWVLIVILVAGIVAAATTSAVRGSEPVDQRTHWQLNSGLLDTKTGKIESVNPASSHDFNKQECL